tara:strand:- start:29 stop:214 length:186 start_codon:yes stop_codon:yes gene_type:complete
MAKDIKMTKGSEEVIVNENSVAKFEKLGYKAINGMKVVIKGSQGKVNTQPKKPEFKNKENK